ncbi:MAG: hypothetical protein Q4G33_05215 [bacterium]|nr:hypothetical protein [bacterium]
MNKTTLNNRSMTIWKISISIVLFFTAGLFIDHEPFKTMTYGSALALLSYDVIISLIKTMTKSPKTGMKLVNDGLLSIISAAGLLMIDKASGAVGVMLFFRILKLLQEKTGEKCRKPFSALAKLSSDHANVRRGNEFVSVPPESVSIGEVIVVKSGERVPLDGIIENGSGFMDTRAFTNESTPREVCPGSEVLSGSINSGSPVYIRVTRTYENSTARHITKLTEEIPFSVSKTESRLKGFSKIYVPAAAAAAASMLIIPVFAKYLNYSKCIYYALIFLAVISPCRLIETVSNGFCAAAGRFTKDGILISAAEYIEAIAKTKTAVFGRAALMTDKEYPDSIVAVSGFAARGIKTVLITEDNESEAKKTAEHLGIDETHCIQNDKHKEYTLFSIKKKQGGRSCIYIGGSDEAGLFETVDAGIALGEYNTAEALENADAVLMTNEPSKLLKAYDISKKAYRIIALNIALAFAAKLAVLASAVFTGIEIWPSVILDSGITILIMGNTLRILKK